MLRYVLKAVALTYVLLGACGCAAEIKDESMVVAGYVVDKSSGEPLPDIEVALQKLAPSEANFALGSFKTISTIRSNNRGYFEFHFQYRDGDRYQVVSSNSGSEFGGAIQSVSLSDMTIDGAKAITLRHKLNR